MQRVSHHRGRDLGLGILVIALLVVTSVELSTPAAAAPAAAAPSARPAPAAAAAAPPEYQVTMVARACNSYTDIFGNRARNDIMESLRDLGPNTPYNPFVQVLPSVEDGQSPQSKCQPLPNWTFAFGTGYGRPAPGTNLSFVSNTSQVNNRRVTTKASTPLLDQVGSPTGTDIAGAVTFTLTSQEASLASQNNRFWVQGGTPTDPLNSLGSDYGFGALRCAKDNLNGDNVEWIGFPSGVTHVFCYAFYVKPPPDAGVINIVKQYANGLTLPASQAFSFDGNLSFNPGGDFSIEVPANANSATKEFVRGAGGTPWTVNEVVPDGFVFVSVACVSANSTSTWTPTGTSVAIELGAGDTITCTYLNDLAPPPSGQGLLIKQTFGDPFGVPPEALPAAWSFDLTTPTNTVVPVSVPVDAATGTGEASSNNLTAGNWSVTEHLPADTAAVRWEFVAAFCVTVSGGNATVNTVVAPAAPTISVNVPNGGAAACSFVNQMVPLSKLTIRLTTHGGTGTFFFQVQGAGDQNIGGTNETVILKQQAKTLKPGNRVTATGDSTDPLYGHWLISPIIPAATTTGRWQVEAAPSCNVAAATEVVGEEAFVEVGAPAPNMICDFVYRFVPPSTLDLVKRFGSSRDGQVDPVSISVICADGTTGELVVPVGGAAPARLPKPLVFVFPTNCSVQELSDGGGGQPVDTAIAVRVNGATAARDANDLQVGAPLSAEAVEVQFTNSYNAVLPPDTLPATGQGRGTSTTLAIGVLLVAAGALLLVVRRRKARTA